MIYPDTTKRIALMSEENGMRIFCGMYIVPIEFSIDEERRIFDESGETGSLNFVKHMSKKYECIVADETVDSDF